MLSFRTELKLQAVKSPIQVQEPILALGSCFAQNISEKLQNLGYHLEINPFGLIYNPLSLSYSLETLLSSRLWTEQDLVFYQGQWHSWSHHGHFSQANSQDALNQINQTLEQARQTLARTKYLFLTLGTAWAYTLDNGQIVNNCHKFPAQHFQRQFLSLDQITQSLGTVLQKIKAQNPQIQVLFTLSPIRHLKDGLIENQRSKASLLLAIHQLIELYPSWIHYFPAYELLLDDLRDYRYYAEDMLHPSPLAQAYIFQQFEQTWLEPKAAPLRKALHKLQLALAHRPKQGEGLEYQNFLAKQWAQFQTLKQTWPQANFQALDLAFSSLGFVN